MALEAWLLYAVAVCVLGMTPGPAVLMCVTGSVNHGVRLTLYSAVGNVTAVLGIMACSAIGLGALLASSEQAFAVLKWFGVLYLLYMGVSTMRAPNPHFELATESETKVSRLGLYVKGLLVGGSNPKALLFFTAFFPQFVNPSAPLWPQYLVLGATFVCSDMLWLTLYATFASRIAPWLRVPGRAKLFNRVSGGLFVAAAALLTAVKRVGA